MKYRNVVRRIVSIEGRPVSWRNGYFGGTAESQSAIRWISQAVKAHRRCEVVTTRTGEPSDTHSCVSGDILTSRSSLPEFRVRQHNNIVR
jgi:hypothetical protein